MWWEREWKRSHILSICLFLSLSLSLYIYIYIYTRWRLKSSWPKQELLLFRILTVWFFFGRNVLRKFYKRLCQGVSYHLNIWNGSKLTFLVCAENFSASRHTHTHTHLLQPTHQGVQYSHEMMIVPGSAVRHDFWIQASLPLTQNIAAISQDIIHILLTFHHSVEMPDSHRCNYRPILASLLFHAF